MKPATGHHIDLAKINLAFSIAEAAFYKKKDLSGKPYFGHLDRIAQKVDTVDQKVIAYLHDLVEDFPEAYSVEELRHLFRDHITDSILLLTHRKEERYGEYIEKIMNSGNQDAIAVKIADLEDNMDLTRLNEINEKDISRLKKYHAAWSSLKT